MKAPDARQLFFSLLSRTLFFGSAQAITRYVPAAVPAGTVSFSVEAADASSPAP